jgi:hypothetical protein
MYGVSVDYILTPHTEEEKANYKIPRNEISNKVLITIVAWLSVWILATILYINLKIILDRYFWMVWIWALPVSSLVLIVFSGIWGKRSMIVASISLFIWTSILALYLQFLQYNIWSLFLLGAPAQLVTSLSAKIKRRAKQE